MNIYVVGLVIFLTSLLVFAVTGCLTRRGKVSSEGSEDRGRVLAHPAPAARKIPLERLADPEPLPYELARAGRFQGASLTGQPDSFHWACPTCPICHRHRHGGSCQPADPFDTGPLLLLSDKAAALDAHEREVKAMCEAAERKIGPVQ